MQRGSPYPQHDTAYARHRWVKAMPSEVGVGDTIVAAAGLGVVTAVYERERLIEFSVSGRGGNHRTNGSPLTYWKGQEIYLHDDSKCTCKKDSDD